MRRAPLPALAFVLAVIAGASLVATAIAQVPFAPAEGSITTIRAEKKHDPCPTPFSFSEFKSFTNIVWAKARWQRGKPEKAGAVIKQAQRMKKCAVSKSHRKAMRHYWKKRKIAFFRYRQFRLIAPYPGGGTYWAIPYYIVYCESGTSGLWMAANPSGAVGPYQLLGWGAPYPADTWAEKMENHRIAAEVWAGGAGASNWVCA